MEGDPHGLPPGSLPLKTSAIASPRVLNAKYAHFFNELNRLASLKSNPAQAIFNTKKNIQELLHGQMSAEMFVIRLHHIFGSYQPGLLQFLKTRSTSISSPSVSTTNSIGIPNTFGSPDENLAFHVQDEFTKLNYVPSSMQNEAVVTKPEPTHEDESHIFLNEEIPIPELKPVIAKRKPYKRKLSIAQSSKPPPVIVAAEPKPTDDDDNTSSTIKNKKDDESDVGTMDDEEKTSSTVPASPKSSQDQVKPVYEEPDDPLLNPAALLKYCNRRKHSFDSITQEAVNTLAEFVNVKFRVFFQTVIEAAKARQEIPPIDDEDDGEHGEQNDVKTQVSVLDSFYLSNDLKYATSDQAQKILASRNNRKREFIEVYNDANETAFAALGGKKRNWASSLIESKTKPKNPFEKPFRVNSADIAFAMRKNKKLANSWAYRNALYLNSAASCYAASKFF